MEVQQLKLSENINLDNVKRIRLSNEKVITLYSSSLIKIFEMDNSAVFQELLSYQPNVEPDEVQISLMGDYYLIQSSKEKYIEIRDVANNRCIKKCQHGDEPVLVLFALHDWEEVAIINLNDKLEVFNLANEEILLTHERSGLQHFRYQQLFQLNDGVTCAGWGYIHGESYNTVFSFSIDELIESGDANFLSYPNDFTMTIAVGACHDDTIVIYRDPDDFEDDFDDEDLEENPMLGFKGFYIQNVKDGSILEKIPWSGAIENGATLLGALNYIAVGQHDHFVIIPRNTGSTNEMRIETNIYAFDPYQRRILFVDLRDFGLKAIQL